MKGNIVIPAVSKRESRFLFSQEWQQNEGR